MPFTLNLAESFSDWHTDKTNSNTNADARFSFFKKICFANNTISSFKKNLPLQYLKAILNSLVGNFFCNIRN